MMLWEVFSFFYEIFSLNLWFNEDQVLIDLSNEFNILKNLHESIDWVNADNSNNDFNAFIDSLGALREIKLLSKSEWVEMQNEIFPLIDSQISVFMEKWHLNLGVTIEEELVYRFEEVNDIILDVESLLLFETTNNMYNVSRLIQAIPDFNKNIGLIELEKLIPSNPEWENIDKNTFFVKLNAKTCLLEKLTEPSKEQYRQSIALNKTLLRKFSTKF